MYINNNITFDFDINYPRLNIDYAKIYNKYYYFVYCLCTKPVLFIIKIINIIV